MEIQFYVHIRFTSSNQGKHCSGIQYRYIRSLNKTLLAVALYFLGQFCRYEWNWRTGQTWRKGMSYYDEQNPAPDAPS